MQVSPSWSSPSSNSSCSKGAGSQGKFSLESDRDGTSTHVSGLQARVDSTGLPLLPSSWSCWKMSPEPLSGCSPCLAGPSHSPMGGWRIDWKASVSWALFVAPFCYLLDCRIYGPASPFDSRLPQGRASRHALVHLRIPVPRTGPRESKFSINVIALNWNALGGKRAVMGEAGEERAKDGENGSMASRHQGAQGGPMQRCCLDLAPGYGEKVRVGVGVGGTHQPQRLFNAASACWSQSLEKYQ